MNYDVAAAPRGGYPPSSQPLATGRPVLLTLLRHGSYTRLQGLSGP